MSIAAVFAFAPIPLTQEMSPLTHAANLTRRRQAEMETIPAPRRRQQPGVAKKEEIALASV